MSDAYQHAHSDAALFDLSDRGLVELAGKEAAAFLHNLCTNDIKALAADSSVEVFLTTAKARVVAHGFVSRLPSSAGDVFWLDVAPGLVEKVMQHLDRYLVSEDVQLQGRSKEIAQMHLCGPRARAVLEGALAEPLPEMQELEIVTRNLAGASCHVRRHDYLALPGFDLFCPRAAAADVRRTLSAVPGSPDAYEILRVEAGFPEYGKDMDEDRFVVEVGRTRQAISYSKGCYLGQEPIVMARDRGHVNRVLLGLKLPEGGPVPAGAKVVRGGEEVGQVTSSVWSPRLGAAIALAYLRRGSQEPETPVEVEGRAAVVQATGG